MNRNLPNHSKKDNHFYSFKTIESTEFEQVLDKDLEKTKRVAEIFIALEIWGLQLITSIEVASLFHPTHFIWKNGKEEHNIFEYYKEQESFYDEELPVKLYLQYPLSKIVELTIQPTMNESPLSNKSNHKELPLGFIAWQIALFFKDVSDGKIQQVEFSGHEIEDLQLTSFVIFENNKFIVRISS
jgi:hypothetical protein